MEDPVLPTAEWPYLLAIRRLALALALGFFVGLERQRRGKEAGVRTFAFAGLLGCLGALLGENFALLSLALVGLLVIFLTIHALRADHGTELTTSAALLVIAFAGTLCGRGHTLTPTAVGVLTAAMLAWKETFTGFSLGLTDDEMRSAILLAILAFVVYPALPEGSVDPWELVQPRSAWITVLLIAGIGFVNYILLKRYGARAVELTGIFGGLVNSSVAVSALADRIRENPDLAPAAYRGVILATGAMVVRNGILLAVLAPKTLVSAGPALALMLIGIMFLVLWNRKSSPDAPGASPTSLAIQSPFSLSSALKFGLIFLVLEVAGLLAQRWLGQFGFYAVSLTGGLISSASSVASAGSLAAKASVSPHAAGIGAVLASLASAAVNFPFVVRATRNRLELLRIAVGLAIVVGLGILGIALSFIGADFGIGDQE